VLTARAASSVKRSSSAAPIGSISGKPDPRN
jgi:hypothetical protein